MICDRIVASRPVPDALIVDLIVAHAESQVPPGLTPAQHRVLKLMAEGNTDNEIARSLVLAELTIRTHAKNISERLGAHSRAHAVALGFRLGWLA